MQTRALAKGPTPAETLLASALLPGMLAMAMVTLAPGASAGSHGWLLLSGFVVAHLAVYVALGRGRRAGDPVLFSVVAFLSGLGLAEVLRLDPVLASRQLGHISVGLAIACVILTLVPDLAVLERYKYVSAACSVLLLGVTIVFGVEAGGARSWIDLGSVAVQPSEAAKILMVVFYAGYLKDTRILLRKTSRRVLGIYVPEPSYVGPLVLMWGISLALLVFQKDLGAALLFFGVFLAMLYMASGRLTYVAGGIVLLAIAGAACYAAFPHVRARIDVWVDPWQHLDSGGYQVTQSLFGLAAGGLIGAGPGLGMPSLIPAAPTDFIFAAICEEMGVLGGLAVVGAYALLAYRGFAWARRSSDDFLALVAAGLSSLIGLQAFTIMAGVVGLVPLTGVTLPFVSYGGSSMIASFAGVALVLRVAREVGGERVPQVGQ